MRTRIDKKAVQRWMLERDIDTFFELAQRAELSPTTLYNVFDSDNWTRRTLDAIASALEVNPLELLVVENDDTQGIALAVAA